MPAAGIIPRVAGLLLVVGLLLVSPSQAAANGPLVDDPGAGLLPLDQSPCEDSGARSRAWRGDLGLLCITVRGPFDDIFIETQVRQSADGAAMQLDVDGSWPLVAHVEEIDTPNPAYLVVFGAAPYLYDVILVQSESAPAPHPPVVDLLDELVSRHADLVAQETGRAVATGPPIDPAGADLEGPHCPVVPGFDLPGLPMRGAHLSARPEGSSELVELFSNGTDSLLCTYHQAELVLVALIVEFRFSTFAAAALGDQTNLLGGDPIELSSATRRPDLVVGGDDEGGLYGAFRRGRIFTVVATNSDGPGGADPAASATAQLSAALFDALPDGPTEPFFFASVGRALLQTAALALVAGSLVVVARSFSARSAQPVPAAPPGLVAVPVGPEAEGIRRRSRILLTIQLVAFSVLVVGLAVLGGTGGIVVAVAATLAAVAAGAAVRRQDRPGLPHQPPAVAPGRLAAGLGVALVVGAGLVLVARGAGTLLFRPWLDHLQWSDRLRVEPDQLSLILVTVGLGLAIAGGLLNRTARRQGRVSVDQLRRVGGAEVLYLRSFDDDRLGIPTIASSRRPTLELFSVRGREPFEECLAWELERVGRTVAVRDPEGRDRGIAGGAQREALPDPTWEAEVVTRMAEAQTIVLVVGATRGLGIELTNVIQRGYLAKTIFVVPPVPDQDIVYRWRHLWEVAASCGLRIAPVNPAHLLTFTVSPVGVVQGFTGAKRDEASYRAALEAAVASLGSGPPPLAPPASLTPVS